MPGMDYRMAQVNDNAGVALMPGETGHPTFYFDTDDIDASIATGAGARRQGRGQVASADARLVRGLLGQRGQRVLSVAVGPAPGAPTA